MSVQKLSPNYQEDTKRKLKNEGDCPAILFLIIDFVFLKMVQDLTQKLDAKFDGKKGRPAYPRTLLLIIVMYCFYENINSYKAMAKECKKNKFILIIMDNKTPSKNTFTNFLNNSDEDTIQRIFVATLVLLNDLKVLNIAKVFIDGTDVIVRGSRHYYIKQKDLKVMTQLNEWNLLHDGSPESIQNTINGLKIKLEEYKDDKEMIKLINHVLRRIKIYKVSVYEKKERYEKEFEKRGDVRLSIIFPESVYMQTKKLIFDFAFNLQEVMTTDHIILTGLPLAQPNDQKVFKEVYQHLKYTIALLLEMQEIYGERRNYKEILLTFLIMKIVADAGYFTTVNLYYIFINRINALIMPKAQATEVNDKLRKKYGDFEKESESEEKFFTRVKGGFECKFHEFLKFREVIRIKHRKPQNKDLPDPCETKRYVFSRKHCQDCPYLDECKQKTELRIPFVIYWMTEKFLDLRQQIHYPARLARSEGINAYHKTSTGILKLVGTTTTAVNNEIQIRNALYNLIRWNNLKETN